jgi:hypothetical protein
LKKRERHNDGKTEKININYDRETDIEKDRHRERERDIMTEGQRKEVETMSVRQR